MPVQRRSTPRFLIVALAVPVVVVVYLSFFSRRLIVGLLGATVIGSVYAETATRTALAPARRAPLPLTLLVGLAMLAGAGLPAAPVQAANAQAEAVVDAALSKVGAPYVWAAEGPDVFDCSGLVYWAFKRAGELPLIGNNRTTAARYMRWFSARGLTSKTDGRRGDLVVYGNGAHIGIYLGNGKVVSALTGGITVHGLHALHNEFTTYLTVAWGRAGELTTTQFVNKVPGSGSAPETEPSDDAGSDEPTTDKPTTTDGGSATEGPGRPTVAADAIARGFAFGSLNLRVGHGPDQDIIGWVSRGSSFDILATGHSPSGALWYKVRKASGKEGWIWSYWVRVTEGSIEG